MFGSRSIPAPNFYSWTLLFFSFTSFNAFKTTFIWLAAIPKQIGLFTRSLFLCSKPQSCAPEITVWGISSLTDIKHSQEHKKQSKTECLGWNLCFWVLSYTPLLQWYMWSKIVKSSLSPFLNFHCCALDSRKVFLL